MPLPKINRSALPLLALTLTAAVCAPAGAAMPGDPSAAFALADVNHNGLVTRDEFKASRMPRFQSLDRNHDGWLSLEDVPAPAALRGRASRLKAMLTRLDKDHDGRVSPQEFIDGSMPLFDAADADHNGDLTREEMIAAFEAARAQLGAP